MDIVVVGGGVGGLGAALLLGRRGHRVTLLERDAHPPEGGPEQVFHQWSRRGVPQARQPHNFLGRSVRVLGTEAPDILDGLAKRGVLRIDVDLGDGPGDAMLCARRLVFESVLREAVEAEANVTVLAGAAVADVGLRPGEVPVVTHVITDTGKRISADVFVDAAGSRSPVAALLESRGCRPVVTTSQPCGLMYISRYYRLRPGHEFPVADSPIMVPVEWAAALAFPADNGTFALLATIAASDPFRGALSEDAGFSRFHSSIPAIVPWVEAGEPISELRSMARIENRYRRLVDADGPIVGGLALVGDAALHTNPTAGRGASLALAQAAHLACCIEGTADPTAFTNEFDAWTAANLGAWYAAQAEADTSVSRRLEAAVQGQPSPPPEPMDLLRGAIFGPLSRHPDFSVLLQRVKHLVTFPSELMADTELMTRIRAAIVSRGAMPPGGPTRDQFTHLLAA